MTDCGGGSFFSMHQSTIGEGTGHHGVIGGWIIVVNGFYGNIIGGLCSGLGIGYLSGTLMFSTSGSFGYGYHCGFVFY